MNIEMPNKQSRWKPRYVCPEHGATSWEHCVACSAELALKSKLAAKRELLQASKERMASTLTNSEGQR